MIFIFLFDGFRDTLESFCLNPLGLFLISHFLDFNSGSNMFMFIKWCSNSLNAGHAHLTRNFLCEILTHLFSFKLNVSLWIYNHFLLMEVVLSSGEVAHLCFKTLLSSISNLERSTHYTMTPFWYQHNFHLSGRSGHSWKCNNVLFESCVLYNCKFSV